MRIAITGRSSLSMGGGELVTMTLARGLHERGHDVTLFVPPFDIPRDPDSDGRAELARGREQEPFEIQTTDSPLFDLPGLPLLWKKMILHPYQALSGNQQEFDHWFVTYGLYPVSEYFHNRGVSVSHYFHSPVVADKCGMLQKYTVYPPLSALYAMTEGATVPAAANSAHTAERVKQRHSIDCRVIYPPVDTEEYVDPIPRDTPGVPTAPFVLLSGRFVPFKKFEQGLRALQPLAERGEVNNVIVAGRLDDRDYYQSLQSTYEFADFQTDVAGETWVALHQHADTYLFTNHKEDFGLTGAEAMSAGTPIVTVDGPGIAEIVSNGENGYVLDRQFSGLANKLEECRARRDSLGAAAQQAVVAACGESTFLDRMVSLSESVGNKEQ